MGMDVGGGRAQKNETDFHAASTLCVRRACSNGQYTAFLLRVRVLVTMRNGLLDCSVKPWRVRGKNEKTAKT